MSQALIEHLVGEEASLGDVVKSGTRATFFDLLTSWSLTLSASRTPKFYLLMYLYFIYFEMGVSLLYL